MKAIKGYVHTFVRASIYPTTYSVALLTHHVHQFLRRRSIERSKYDSSYHHRLLKKEDKMLLNDPSCFLPFAIFLWL